MRGSSVRLGLLLTMLSCSGSRASIEIEDARASWVNLAVNRHIFVDIDVLAHDQLGDNIGSYCTTLTITFQPNIVTCAEDLSDGDRKTIRIESAGDVPDAVAIGVGIRHAGVNTGRGLVGPRTP